MFNTLISVYTNVNTLTRISTTLSQGLFVCIDNNDLLSLQEMLADNPEININCRNYLSYTPLLQVLHTTRSSYNVLYMYRRVSLTQNPVNSYFY